MFRFLKHLFGASYNEKEQEKARQDFSGKTEGILNSLNQPLVESESVELQLNSIELNFLKYVNGAEVIGFIPAKYWYYECGLDYKTEIAKFLAENLLFISASGDIEKKTVPQLKECLKMKGLSLAGKKADLITRIRENFSENDLESLFPRGRQFYKLTFDGKKLIANLKKSATKNIELEDHCIELILNNEIDEAYKAVATFRASVPGQFGIGIDWHKEMIKGLSKKYLSLYEKALSSAKSDDNRKIAACYILCEMAGISHKRQLIINRVCNLVDSEFLCELIEKQNIQTMKEELKGYKQEGLIQYQIIATLDTETCPQCGQMDCQTFDISDAKIGKNCPPFHSGCRCCIVPYIPGCDDSAGFRAARDPVTGKSISVPMMPYIEWYKKYIKSK